MQLNKTVQEFLNKMNINYSMCNGDEAECKNKRDINMIISRYGMYKNKKNKKVCVADVIGKDRGKTQNIINELNDLFDSTGELYKRRSVSMLQYNSNEIVDKLTESFYDEPIELKEIKKGKYIIGNNGMHRINLLRLHYLSELNKCKTQKEIEILNKRYTIDVKVEEIDFIKTYSKFLINLIKDDVIIEDEIDNQYKKTDNVIIYSTNADYNVYNNTQLISYVKDKINNQKNIECTKEIVQLYNLDENFRKYLKMILDIKIINKIKLYDKKGE